MPPTPPPAPRRPIGRLIIGSLLLLAVCALLWYYRAPLALWLADIQALRRAILALGAWGPLLLIAILIAQIVIAPIPGYALYVAAGFLYGTLAGGLIGAVGLLLGGMLAMAVARTFSRPVVQWLIGRQTLAHWEEVVHTDSLLVWGVLMLSPIGDAPFLLAGLSSISFPKMFALALATRVPGAFVAAALGAGAMVLSWWQLALIITALALPLLIVSRYQTQIRAWLRAHVGQIQNIESDE